MPKPILIIIYAAVAILTAAAVFKYILPIVVPFIIALVFGIFMEPLINTLQHKARMSRGLAALFSVIILFGGIALVIFITILQLVVELIQLSVSLPGVAAEMRLFYQDLIEKTTAFYVTLPHGVITTLEQNITNLTANLQGLISRVVDSILLLFSLVPGTLAIIIVILLATYFLARDRHRITERLVQIIPPPWGEKTMAVIHEISNAFVGYLRAQFILISITTLISVFGLYLIGAEYALTMGLLVGLFDLIPVLGPATIYIPWIIWSFATGATAFGIKITVLYVLVIIVRQLLEAKIVSANIGLHPLATLFAMYAGLKTMGITGLILGPIILIALQAVIKVGALPIKIK